MKNHYLSKSQFMRGLQCHKSLWLYKYMPELREEPDESKQAVFDSGKEVGLLARGLFPGGKAITFEGSSFDEKVRLTKELIESGIEIIYEATFCYNDILVMVDILHKGKKGWEIYEVKQSTEVKDEHKSDISIQYHVVSGSGLSVTKANLVHINREYIRNGDINIRELFLIEDLTKEVIEKQGFVKDELKKMQHMLKNGCPDIAIGAYCHAPYACDFISYCWKHIPDNSVFDISGTGINKFASYREGKVSFKDLDLKELNFKQRMQVDAELNGTVTIDKKGIREFLDTLRYPIYFLDFEVFYQEPIPPFDGTRPYMRIPFQYSLNWIEKAGGKLHHHEFLVEAGKDGREEIAKQLSDMIPDKASVAAYNTTFEIGVIKALAEGFSAYRKKLISINENMIDMMVPFRKRYYYIKEMKGSYSLKNVLPAIFPELSYEGLAVSGGEDAVMAYKRLAKSKDSKEKVQITKDLLEYCKLDTLGMVSLLERLRLLAAEKG